MQNGRKNNRNKKLLQINNKTKIINPDKTQKRKINGKLRNSIKM